MGHLRSRLASFGGSSARIAARLQSAAEPFVLGFSALDTSSHGPSGTRHRAESELS